MDKKRFFLTAAAGLLVANPVAATLNELDKKLDAALDVARSEQPLVLEADDQAFNNELPARMY